MKTTAKIVAMLGVALLALPGATRAQTVDARWQAWIGCWKPAVDGATVRGRDMSSRVCVTPAAGVSAVEITSIAAGKVVERTRIDAGGAARAVSRDGCTGTESAHWSTIATRLYLNTSLTCTGGVQRRGTGVLSFTENGEWLDIRGMTSNKASGVAVGRFVAVGPADSESIPVEVRRATPARVEAMNAAALVASAPLTLGDIVEVSAAGDSSVTATWLIERTRGLKLSIDGKKLATLADAGVPASVIDLSVALAYPSVFALDARSGGTERRMDGQRVTSQGADLYQGSPLGYYGGYYGGFYGYSPYDSFFGYGPFSSLYGYRYGYGYGAGYYPGYGGYSPYYGGYYSGPQTIVVVKSDATAPQHGRVVKGQGYTSGRGGTSSPTTASPRALTSGGGSGSGSTGSSSSGTSSAGTSSGSSGGGRTAVKKP
jgi:hypothetical protein